MFLKRLSSSYSVEKDYDAPLFYREEGNRKFQEKEYTGAAVLYSKVTCVRPALTRKEGGVRVQARSLFRFGWLGCLFFLFLCLFVWLVGFLRQGFSV